MSTHERELRARRARSIAMAATLGFAGVGIAVLAAIVLGRAPAGLLQNIDPPASLHVSSPGEAAAGTQLDLSSFDAAVTSISSGDVRIDWPGGDDLGDTAITNLSVQTNAGTKTILFQGGVTIETNPLAAMLILDWDTGPTPSVSLGVKGELDVSTLNADWDLQGEAFVIDGYFGIATGQQDLSAQPSAIAFYDQRTSLPAGLEVRGSMSVAELFPGIGVDGALAVTVGATFEADIAAVLTSRPLEPQDAGAAQFTASLSASSLKIPSAPGLSATNFDVILDLAGQQADQFDGAAGAEGFTISARGTVTIDDDALSAQPVTFDIAFRRVDDTTEVSGGVAEGANWVAPFGVDGVTVSELRLSVSSDGASTPKLELEGALSIGDVGVAASITVNDDIAVELAVDEVTVEQIVSVFDAVGVDTSSLDLDSELASVTVGPTMLELRTEGPDVAGALRTSLSFRGKTAALLLAGDTSVDGGLLAAVSIDEFTVGDLWADAPAPLDTTKLPSGGFIVSSGDVSKSDFEPGGIEDTYLSALYCDPDPAADPGSCSYAIASGVTLAGQIPLDPGLHAALSQIVPLSNEPVRIEGNLPVFEPGPFRLKVSLPPLRPDPGTAASAWLDEGRLFVELTADGTDLTAKVRGELDVLIPDEEFGDDGYDAVTFGVDATVELGLGSASITLGADIVGATGGGPWESPFGIDWIDLNGFRMEITIIAAPDPGVQLGFAASAQLNGQTYDASFAIKVTVGSPIKVEAGLRIFAQSLSIDDIARLAERVAGDPVGTIDTDGLPKIALKNVEVAVSTIDAPSLCLTQGITIGANIHLDDASPSMDSPGPANTSGDLCTDASVTPEEGIAACALNPDCFAHARFALSEDGITAAASLGAMALGPVEVSEASLAISMTPQTQSFKISGWVTVAGFVRESGSLSLGSSIDMCIDPATATIPCPGFEFALDTEEVGAGATSGSAGANKVTIHGAGGLDPNVAGFRFNLNIFVRIPALNTALVDAQDVVSFLSDVFTGEPSDTIYSIRCVEIDVAVQGSTSDAISGSIQARVHFSATKQSSGYEQGRVWSIGWDFDQTAAQNAAGLLSSLQGNTSVDAIGCGVEPTIAGFSFPPNFTATYGTPFTVSGRFTSRDFSTYAVTLDLDDGLAPRIVAARRYVNGEEINVSANVSYPQGEAGYERRAIVARVHQNSIDGPVIQEITFPILIASNDVTGYSVDELPAVVEQGDTIPLSASWTNAIGTLGIDSVWAYNIRSDTNDGDFELLTFNGTTIGFPDNSMFTHDYEIPIPASCACEVFVRHQLKKGNDVIEQSERLFLVEFTRPEIGQVSVDGSLADPGIASVGSMLSVQIDDPDLDGPYELYVNGEARPTTGSGNIATAPLADFYVGGEVTTLNIQVRSEQDGAWVKSAVVKKDVVYRPLNSSSATPVVLALAAGQYRAVTGSSTTLYPVTADDVPDAFGSADCGAVWFEFTPVANGRVRLATDGSRTLRARPDGSTTQELALAVFDGGGTVVAQISPDGDPSITTYPQTLVFDALGGTTYSVAVAASDVAPGCAHQPTVSGPVTLSALQLDVPPLQDSTVGTFERFSDGLVLLESSDPDDPEGNWTTLDFATADASGLDGVALSAPGFSSCFDDPLEQTLWYGAATGTGPDDLPADRDLEFAPFQLNGDLQVAVFDVEVDGGGNVTNSTLIDCNESGPSFWRGDSPFPVARFRPAVGREYRFLIDTNGRQPAEAQATILAAGSSLFSAIRVDTGDAPIVYPIDVRSLSNTLETPLPCTTKTIAHDTYFLWTADTAAPVDIRARFSDVVLAVVPIRNGLGALTDAADISACSDRPGEGETISLNPSIGQSYLFIVASDDSEATGSFEFSVSVRGDRGSIVRRSFPVREVLSNVGATSDNRSGSCYGGGVDTTSIGVGFDIPADLDVDIDTIDSDFDTRVRLENVAQEIDCNDDIDVSAGLLTSRIRASLADGDGGGSGSFSEYYLTIDGFNGATGSIDLDVTTRGDDRHNAVAISGSGAASTLNTSYATVEPGELRGGCHYASDALKRTVWWSWTADEDGIFDIAVTGFDAQLTLFAGDTDEIIGCGEDEGPNNTPLTQLAARAGDVVNIQVDGWQTTAGDATVQVTLAGPYDTDGDDVDQLTDNCPGVFNPDQLNADDDALGDACDDDDDNDGVLDPGDNCRTVPNPGQGNIDGDALGDACDDDNDNDGVLDPGDNCPSTPNAGQADLDGDLIGDVCDDDVDGDDVPNATDNCPTSSNADQADVDSDGIGDACDPTNGCTTLPAPVANEVQLRRALRCFLADTSAGDRTIRLTADISLTSGLPPIVNVTPGRRLVIDGAGHRIDANGHARVLYVSSVTTVSIRDIELTGGNDFRGGGIANEGSLTLVGSTIIGNTASIGGGIANSGDLVIVNSTITGNTATRGGGVHSSTTDILPAPVKTVLQFTTITANSAPVASGLEVEHAGNGTTTLARSIVAGNSGGNDIDVNHPDAPPVAISGGGNVVGTASAQIGLTSTDVTGSNPRLGPLRDNGGPTRTHALQSGSPAIDLVPLTVSDLPTTDQRGTGFARVKGPRADAGAFEWFGDTDGDGVIDTTDNCPAIANAGQADADGDGLGDVCDPTPDPVDDVESFVSFEPARFADTRDSDTFDNDYRNTGPRAAKTSWEIAIAGRGGVPADATAAIVNVTVLNAAANGFATVYPCTPTLPKASSINYTPGAVEPNELIAKLSGTGTICVYTLTQADVIVDVVGAVAPNSPYTAITPTRYADSRDEPTFDNQRRNTGIRRSDTIWRIPIAGRGSVPTDAAAVAANITVTGATNNGFATVYPCTPTVPKASSINYGPGVTRPNELVTKLSTDGHICVYVKADVHVIIDIVGHLGATPNYTPITPTRYADSRDEPTFDNQRRNTGIRRSDTIWEIPIAGRGTVPATATTATVNLTVTGAPDNGFATVYPCTSTIPKASSINYGPGITRPNELIAKLSPAGTICVYAKSATHIIIDIAGHNG